MDDMRIESIDGLTLDGSVHRPDLPNDKSVLLVHGITVSKDEGGMFVRLADALARDGYLVVRFSFRGHGASDGTQEGVTIAGEMLDVVAAMTTLRQLEPKNGVSVVAASFGAVSTLLTMPRLGALDGLVLWNPVLDLRQTFLDPTLPWGKENFGSRIEPALASLGYVEVDGSYRLGPVIFIEMAEYEPLHHLNTSDVPCLIVHGDADTYVSVDVSRTAAERRPGSCDFRAVPGSDHGFDGEANEALAIEQTVAWLRELPGA